MGADRVFESSKFVDVWEFTPAKPVAWFRHFGATQGRLLRLWLERSRQRNELSELDPHILRDIGVTEEQARRETLKVFWQE